MSEDTGVSLPFIRVSYGLPDMGQTTSVLRSGRRVAGGGERGRQRWNRGERGRQRRNRGERGRQRRNPADTVSSRHGF